MATNMGVFFFVSFSAALADLIKNIANAYKPCLFYALWPLPALLPSLCSIYHCHHPTVDHQAVPSNVNLTAWTLQASARRKRTACPCSISDCAHQKALCPKSRMLFLLSSFSHCTDLKHEVLSNVEMDSGRCVAESNFAVLGGISVRNQLFPVYIFYYSTS